MTDPEQLKQQLEEIGQRHQALKLELRKLDQEIFWERAEQVFAAHPELDFIAWRQKCQWNGSFYETEIEDFRLNHYLVSGLDGFEVMNNPHGTLILHPPEESYLKKNALIYSPATFVELFPPGKLKAATKAVYVLFLELFFRFGEPFFLSGFGIDSIVRVDRSGVMVGTDGFAEDPYRHHRAEELGMF